MLTLEQKFWAKVDTSGDCWIWTGSKLPAGYGNFRADGLRMLAHRFSLSLVEPLVEGLQIDHLCRNTSCVRPSHLEQVTQAENIRRAFAVKVQSARCANGHDYTPDNTYINSNGHRECFICRRKSIRESNRRYVARKKAGQ